MVKVRQDAWSHEDDLLLAETVLRHIREGSTQLRAFDEVGDALNRTSAACGFRWNAEVRQRYESAIDLAKRKRKEKKRALAQQVPLRKPSVEEQEVEVMETIALPALPTQEPATISYEDLGTSVPAITFDQVIHYVKDLKKQYEGSYESEAKISNLQQENGKLQEHNHTLQQQLAKLEKQYASVQEDYQMLIQIMDRARKMVVFDEEDQVANTAFRMDKNGNLEQVAR
ncbi:transcriptional regulator [Pontibacillus halophilus JSM 076056 = DSM 19796]|uniref:Transcriptional regulator n=1 Tax=Pontibacillus halophilus JSM 076056 = DSM 19796 TaxID=1385510 RepID=A0A0A5GQN6_9BACI|nr:RsfA family transcriptional regulator [Pontibacillus halophilus]KGX93523.1 transcriptional regulator [Pontibacillus halophilus JSM 076056 = DSM 19796]